MANPVHVKYTGPSMNPTLKAGDNLETIPYAGSKISVGDIVVFHPRERSRNVVHRVVALGFFGVKTRGDNNSEADPYVIPPNRIIGKVVAVQRGDINIPIHGGKQGSISANFLWAKNRIDLTISRMLNPAYHWLSRTGILRRLSSPFFKPSILCFKRPAGTEMQLVIGRWVIGRRFAGQNQWRIRRPFRLLVDEALLTDENSI